MRPGFHSTDCPSEWGPLPLFEFQYANGNKVSIQLIAPASGAGLVRSTLPNSQDYKVSIQLIAPASGALIAEAWAELERTEVSIQLIAPASGANDANEHYSKLFDRMRFPFN